MESYPKQTNAASYTGRRGLDDGHSLARHTVERFTSGQFFAEAGVILAVCLGLALLAHPLVAILGAP